jgi:hypothetical protein
MPAEEEVLKPTPSTEWQSPRKIGFTTQLPSGNIIRMKRTLDLLGMLEGGSIPNPLDSRIRRSIEDGKPFLNFNEMDEASKIQTIEWINGCVVRAVISPAVWLVPDGKDWRTWEAPHPAISIEDLTLEDRLFIFQAAQGGAASVERFRELQAQLVASLSDVPGVAPEAEQPVGA